LIERIVKLRIRGNSIRFRLGQSEVRDMVEHGFVQEATEFGGGASRLVYRLEAVDGDGPIQSTFRDGRLTVAVPRATIQRWATTAQVGIADDGPPGIVIEKDFACLDDRAGESEADAFPNPQRCR
jgi:hypothetical protein